MNQKIKTILFNELLIFFKLQERDHISYQQASSPSSTQARADDDILGAAGLWAQSQSSNQQSFQCNASPLIKSEPQHQHPVNTQQRRGLITNQYEFVCSICEMFVIEEQGVVLKTCGHSFCHICLVASIENKSVEAHCPMVVENCGVEISDEEVQALLTPEAYLKYLDKCINMSQRVEPIDLMNSHTVPALLDLENYDYIENREKFLCAICLTDKQPGEGLMLKNCLHEYCKGCLGRTIEMSDELEVPCPFVAEDGSHCEGLIQDRELRSLISPDVYEEYLTKSLVRAEAVIKDSFHCQTANCLGWAEKGEGATHFHCPVCLKINCIQCKAVHEGKSCEDFFYEINADARKARDQQLTAAQEAALIARREAMNCPGCGVVIQKTTGCNHMTCSRCKRQFQWLGLQ